MFYRLKCLYRNYYCRWVPVYTSPEQTLGVMSIGFLLNKKDDPVVWRGPKKNGILNLFNLINYFLYFNAGFCCHICSDDQTIPYGRLLARYRLSNHRYTARYFRWTYHSHGKSQVIPITHKQIVSSNVYFIRNIFELIKECASWWCRARHNTTSHCSWRCSSRINVLQTNRIEGDRNIGKYVRICLSALFRMHQYFLTWWRWILGRNGQSSLPRQDSYRSNIDPVGRKWSGFHFNLSRISHSSVFHSHRG